MFNQHSTKNYTPVPKALEGIDPEFAKLACRLANCRPEDLLAVAWRDDTLVVVVQPGPKHVFTAQQIFDAGWRDGQLVRDQLNGNPPFPHGDDNPRFPHGDPRLQGELKPAPTPTEVAALEHVAAAHPGELAAAVHNAPPAETYDEQRRKAGEALTEAERHEAEVKAEQRAVAPGFRTGEAQARTYQADREAEAKAQAERAEKNAAAERAERERQARQASEQQQERQAREEQEERDRKAAAAPARPFNTKRR